MSSKRNETRLNYKLYLTHYATALPKSGFPDIRVEVAPHTNNHLPHIRHPILARSYQSYRLLSHTRHIAARPILPSRRNPFGYKYMVLMEMDFSVQGMPN